MRLGKRIWRDGYRYAKAGVMLTNLVSDERIQPSFLVERDREQRIKMWRLVDKINADFGRGDQAELGRAGGLPVTAMDYEMGGLPRVRA